MEYIGLGDIAMEIEDLSNEDLKTTLLKKDLENSLEDSTTQSLGTNSYVLVNSNKNKCIFAWGNTVNGELGIGGVEEEQISIPTQLQFSGNVDSISCGDAHTVFVLADGTVWSCGNNDHGQLGHTKGRTRPELVEGLAHSPIVSISAGFAHNIAVDKWGTVFTWGSDSHGQLGLQIEQNEDKLVRRPRVVKSLSSKVIVQVAAGHFHSLVLTNAGEIYTCGSNSHGQLGLGYANGPNQTRFCLIEMLVGFPTALISAGGFHSFVLSVSGSVYGWGKNNYGQLGIGSVDDKCQPTALSTLKSLGVKYITCGSDFTSFLTEDGGVFTCGSGAYGQLGHGTLSNEVLPRKILDFGKVVTQIACGRCHTICWTNDRLYSFGLNTSGQLGYSNGNKNTPVHVQKLTYKVESIYAGGDHTMVLVTGLDAASNIQVPVSAGDTRDYRLSSYQHPILTITNDNISKLCNAEEPVDQELMTIAETIFASPSIWNASFLLPNGKHVPSTWRNIGVSLLEADVVLSKLEIIKAPGLRDYVDQWIYSELLPKLPHQLKHVEILRVYVLLPLIPNFYSAVPQDGVATVSGNNLLLPIFYADRLQSLAPQLLSTVTRWLYSSPKEHIVRLISVYKRTILSVLEETNQSQSQRDHALRICLNFLSLLNNLNRVDGRLSYHTFAIPQLTSKVDIRMDYFHWLQRKTHTRSVYFCDFPFVFDAQAKTLLLQTDQILQMQNAMNKAANQLMSTCMFSQLIDPQEVQYLVLNVSRDNLVNDVVNQMYTLNTHDLKKPLKIKFIGEEAEDAGGVKKEFFLLLIREILDPKYGMFKNYDDSRLMWFNEGSFEEDVMYFLIGLLCGLAIYNFTIINLPFPLALYKKLLEEKIDLHDLKELSPSEGRSLEHLMNYREADFEQTFCLTFEITREEFGAVKTVPLKPDGANIPVTQENKSEFVDLYVSYVFQVACNKQFEAFKQGFQRVCGSTVLQLFHSQELQAMVTGNEDYDWGELERNCTYKSGYHVDDPTIILFWDVFHCMTLPEKKQFLLFLTGSDRIPILGMKTLKLCIQPTGDERYLPVAHTCFNLLDLPRYQTRERLKYKLLQAIQQNQGFSIV